MSSVENEVAMVMVRKVYEDESWAGDVCKILKEKTVTEVVSSENWDGYFICHVLESLQSSNPKAFIPKFMGLGPYHHYDEKLFMTDEMKLAAAKRLKGLFPDLQDQTNNNNNMAEFKERLTNFASDPFAFYHPDVKSTYNYTYHTLLYVLTVDGFFLLALIQFLIGPNAEDYSFFLTGMPRKALFSEEGDEELTKDAIMRDLFMLENQIPFQILLHVKGINRDQFIQAEGEIEKELLSNLLTLCKQHCPFVEFNEENILSNNPKAHHHLLDLMYCLTVPESLLQAEEEANKEAEALAKAEAEYDQIMAVAEAEAKAEAEEEANSVSNHPSSRDKIKEQKKRGRGGCCFTCIFYMLLSVVFLGIILYVVVKLILKLIWWLLRPLFRIVVWALNPLIFLLYTDTRLSEAAKQLIVTPTPTRPSPSAKLTKYVNPTLKEIHQFLIKVNIPYLHKLTELIGLLDTMTRESLKVVRPVVMIPSVTELASAGIRVEAARGRIHDSLIQFDEQKFVLYLPSIKVNVNSEVILKNLVAYETLLTPNDGPLVFTRYIELMRAIIDTAEDVKLLVSERVIHSELSDEAVEKLFSGMSKSIRDTNTPNLDQVIRDVNRIFKTKQDRNKIVSMFMPGKIFAAVGGLVFLALTAMQTYCSFFSLLWIWNLQIS